MVRIDRQTHTHRKTDTHTDRHTETDREGETDRDRQTYPTASRVTNSTEDWQYRKEIL